MNNSIETNNILCAVQKIWNESYFVYEIKWDMHMLSWFYYNLHHKSELNVLLIGVTKKNTCVASSIQQKWLG